MLIENVVLGWEDMEGESSDLKKLNSLLTSALISQRNMPSDECLGHAKVVQGFFLSGGDDWYSQSQEYLTGMFVEATDGQGVRRHLPKARASCAAAMMRVEKLLLGGPWPDRLVAV